MRICNMYINSIIRLVVIAVFVGATGLCSAQSVEILTSDFPSSSCFDAKTVGDAHFFLLGSRSDFGNPSQNRIQIVKVDDYQNMSGSVVYDSTFQSIQISARAFDFIDGYWIIVCQSWNDGLDSVRIILLDEQFALTERLDVEVPELPAQLRIVVRQNAVEVFGIVLSDLSLDSLFMLQIERPNYGAVQKRTFRTDPPIVYPSSYLFKDLNRKYYVHNIGGG